MSQLPDNNGELPKAIRVPDDVELYQINDDELRAPYLRMIHCHDADLKKLMKCQKCNGYDTNERIKVYCNGIFHKAGCPCEWSAQYLRFCYDCGTIISGNVTNHVGRNKVCFPSCATLKITHTKFALNNIDSFINAAQKHTCEIFNLENK